MALPPDFSTICAAAFRWRRSWGARSPGTRARATPPAATVGRPARSIRKRSASFHVDEAKGFYYCFGCHAKGDAISFLRETENLGFIEAVERLAARGRHADARARSRRRRPRRRESGALARRWRPPCSSTACSSIRPRRRGARLPRPPRPRTRHPRTLRDRLRARQPHRALRAPDRQGLRARPAGRGRPRRPAPRAAAAPTTASAAGSCSRSATRRGRAIAFGARAIAAGQEPKYLNSPDTPLFDKGRSLYNVGPARAAAAKAGTVVVTEGYMDVIALAQAGLDHAVAPLGTAITEAQLELLWKLAPEPVVALDGDAAGLAAAQRLIDLALPLLGPGSSLRFALMPPGQDPDDVVRARRRRGDAGAARRLAADGRPDLDPRDRRRRARQPRAARRARRAAARPSRPHRRPALRTHWEREIRSRRAALFAPPPRPRARAARPRAAPGRRRAARARRRRPARRCSAARRSGQPPEARIRESAILLGCLNHPAVALRRRGPARTPAAFAAPISRRFATPSCRRSRGCLDQPDRAAAVAAAVTCASGAIRLPELAALGQLRANPHLGPAADPEQAAPRDRGGTDPPRRPEPARAAEVRDAEVELAGEADEGADLAAARRRRRRAQSAVSRALAARRRGRRPRPKRRFGWPAKR